MEEVEDDGWSKAAVVEAPAEESSGSTAKQKCLPTSTFASGTSRFKQGPTEKDGTPVHVGPGSHAHERGTMASTMSDKNRTPRFAFGQTSQGSPREELKVTAAQMAYEIKGDQFLNEIEKHPDGWLRTDYHRWIIAATNRSDYMHHREEIELARQLKEEEDRAYRENGARTVAAVIATRHNASKEIKTLRESRKQAGLLDKRDSGCRSRLLKARSEAWREYAATCVEEAKQLQESARRARGLEEQKRARVAAEMRAYQRQQEQEKREEDELRVEDVRAAKEASREGKGRNVDWRSATIANEAAFQALTAEQKQAVDEANSDNAAARERARERAKLARKKEKEAATARSTGALKKNLTELVKEDTAKRIQEQKERVIQEAEREKERVAKRAAIEAAEEAAAAEAIRIAEEAAAAAAAVAAAAAEAARLNKEKRDKAAAQKKSLATKLKPGATSSPTPAPLPSVVPAEVLS